MTLQIYIFPILMVLLAGGYTCWLHWKRQQALANAGPAFHAFFQRTGFRYSHLPLQPIDLHVKHAMAAAKDVSLRLGVTQYVRDFYGILIRFEQGAVARGNGMCAIGSWSTPLQSPPRIRFHIAERRFVDEMASDTTRNWSPRFPLQVEIGNPALDDRFAVFGPDPAAVRRLFQDNPGLGTALMECAEVDLWVDAQGAVFSDPMQRNFFAATGGQVGNAVLGFDMAKRMDLVVPVHERMSAILAKVVRCAQ